MTQREAEKYFGIPRSTVKNKHDKPIGHPRVFTDSEEKAFEEHLIKLSDYGYFVFWLVFEFFTLVESCIC